MRAAAAAAAAAATDSADAVSFPPPSPPPLFSTVRPLEVGLYRGRNPPVRTSEAWAGTTNGRSMCVCAALVLRRGEWRDAEGAREEAQRLLPAPKAREHERVPELETAKLPRP